MTVKTIFAHERYLNIGASTDTKPTGQSPLSTFYAYDTFITYITYDGTNWVVFTTPSLEAGTSVIGKVRLVDSGGTEITESTNQSIGVRGVEKTLAVEQVIDGSLGAYAVGDVVGADDCCTTLAITWIFDIGRAVGKCVDILGATLFNETENQAVQYDFLLFNAVPTGELRDNAANTNPLKEDRTKYEGMISFPYSVAKGASVATTAEAYPGDGVSKVPKVFQCAAADTKAYCVLVTNTIYTQTPGDIIRITLRYIQN